MKSLKVARLIALAFFAALAIPVRVAAQDNQDHKHNSLQDRRHRHVRRSQQLCAHRLL